MESHIFTEKPSAISQQLPVQQSSGERRSEPYLAAQQQNDEPPITTDQAVEFFCGKIHPKTLERKARNGKVPAYQRFGHWFYFKSELRDYLRRQQVKSPQPIGPA